MHIPSWKIHRNLKERNRKPIPESTPTPIETPAIPDPVVDEIIEDDSLETIVYPNNPRSIARWMRLAPRNNPTIRRTIESFRKVFGDDMIYIFAEPTSLPYDLDGIKNISILKNNTRLGDVKNYENALSFLYKETKADFICVLEDDLLFHPDARTILTDTIAKLKNKFGYLSLRTDTCSGIYVTKPGWNDVSVNGAQRVGRWLTGNVFLYPRDVVRQILEHPYYINHTNTYKRQNASDCQIAETVKQLWLKTLYHNPSLTIHTGNTSTLWHDADNKRVDVSQSDFYSKKVGWERIVIGIATIPERERFLESVIKSLYNQADEINVWLNKYQTIPKYLLNDPKIRPILLDNSTGDAAKYFFVHEVYGYYITCDDDLLYPPDYVATLIKWINHIGKDKCIVGSHGHNFKKFVWQFNPEKDISHYYYFNDLVSPLPIKTHIVGTGTAAFHTDALQLHYQDFAIPNKADEQMAVICKMQDVQPYVIPHKRWWIQDLDVAEETPALWRQTNRYKRIDWYKVNLFPLLRNAQ